jgi:hypothetical protein
MVVMKDACMESRTGTMGAKHDFPHLAFLVGDEHDPTGEIEKALDKIDAQAAEIVALAADLENAEMSVDYWMHNAHGEE